MLQLMALGIPDVMNFDFMSKPSPGRLLQQQHDHEALLHIGTTQSVNKSSFVFNLESVRSAVEHLELLGAVERKEDQVLLTALGKKMASFPLEPRYAKVKKKTSNEAKFFYELSLFFALPYTYNGYNKH